MSSKQNTNKNPIDCLKRSSYSKIIFIFGDSTTSNHLPAIKKVSKQICFE
tara:strand:+ start:245 stop:394 length:150 start_codon:yes stop_codon:yes gene_type:complete